MSPSDRLADAFSSPGVDVLHVEDDEEYAELVRMWVAAHGLVLNRVRSRAEMRKYLATRAFPRCLLLDMGLKDSSGLGLCDELKGSPSLQGVPIILLSASNLTACECQGHGAIHLLRKGIDGEAELLAALTSVIAQHERSRGVVTCGDLRLEPQERTARIAGEASVRLDPRPFDALLYLVKAAPNVVTDLDMYVAFMQRGAYHLDNERKLAIRGVVINYVSRLRRKLGPAVGDRIVRINNQGFMYRVCDPAGKDIF